MIPSLYTPPRPNHLRQLLKNVKVEYSPNASALSTFGRENVQRSLVGELGLGNYLHKYWNSIDISGDSDTPASERNVLNFKVISNTSANVLSKSVQRVRLRRRWSAALREAVKLSMESEMRLKLRGNLEVAVLHGFGYREPMSELVEVSSAVLEMIASEGAATKSITNAHRQHPSK